MYGGFAVPSSRHPAHHGRTADKVVGAWFFRCLQLHRRATLASQRQFIPCPLQPKIFIHDHLAPTRTSSLFRLCKIKYHDGIHRQGKYTPASVGWLAISVVAPGDNMTTELRNLSSLPLL